MYISIVIPAYNEASRIVNTLEQTTAYLESKDYDSEIVVVSDGSSDNTKEIVQNFIDKSKIEINFMEYFPNRGKGYAVKFGMLHAKGDYVMFMDADYSVPMHCMEDGLKLIAEGADIAIGSRGLKESRITHHQNPLRELSAEIYTIIQNIYLGLSFKDTQCGFKIFSREAVKDIFPLQKLNSVIFDPEILWLASKKGYSINEFAVEWEHQEDSRIVYDSIDKFLFVFKELFRIKKLHRP